MIKQAMIPFFASATQLDPPDRKREVAGVGLAGPTEEATVLSLADQQFLRLLPCNVRVKPPAGAIATRSNNHLPTD